MVETIRQHESLARRIADGGISEAQGWIKAKGLTTRPGAARKPLPDARAIYAFMRGDEPLYIGCASRSLRRRIAGHDKYWMAIDAGATHITYLPVGKRIKRPEMLKIERALIERYEPSLCRCLQLWRRNRTNAVERLIVEEGKREERRKG